MSSELNVVMETIEHEDEGRLSAFPLKYPGVYALWKQQRELRWETSEIDSHLEKDKIEISDGSVDVKVLLAVKFMLAFFAVSDGLVIDIIQEKLGERIKSREHKMVYAAITEAENIHNVTYSKLIEAYEPNSVERNKLFNATINYPSVRRLVNMLRNWAEIPVDGAPVTMVEKEMIMEGPIVGGKRTYVKNTYTEVAPSLAQLLMGNMIMEGTCFPSEFTKIYYIYDFLRILGGLYKANEFISRDENTHVQFGVYNYIHHVENKLSTAVVHAMMREAASVMAEFINDSIPEPMVIMNAPHLIQYVHFVQDNLCTVLGYDKIWGVTNPFSFMEKQSYGVRISDFFVDKSISEYGHTRANLDASDATMDFSEDF